MLTRRDLLKQSALLSLSPLVPTFLSQAARAATAESDSRVLVVIQLDGGNDGLNTVVPYRDENYARLRPKLKIEAKRLVKLNDEIGLHPALKPAGKLFDAGRLAIVQGVGYPNPNRSHFESMAIWQSAYLDDARRGQYGWLGRALDAKKSPQRRPDAVYVGPATVPVTLWGRRSTTAALTSLEELALTAPAELLHGAVKTASAPPALEQFVAGNSDEAFTTAERLSALARPPALKGPSYPDSKIGEQLKLISALLKSGSQARVYYAAQSGYDTHATQSYQHSELLHELAEALAALSADLEASRLGDRVLVLAFSEFGRRAAENDSEGTDHGAAAPVILVGPSFAAGVLGSTPNLADLQDGDVKTSIDFRQVYATVLDQWLGVTPQDVLSGEFAQLNLFRT